MQLVNNRLQVRALLITLAQTHSEPIYDKGDLQRLYPDRFTGTGQFSGEYHITLKEDAHPVVQPPRKYPIQIKDELKTELDRMESLDVIS